MPAVSVISCVLLVAMSLQPSYGGTLQNMTLEELKPRDLDSFCRNSMVFVATQARKRKIEIRFRDCDANGRGQFREARRVGIREWLKNEVVEAVLRSSAGKVKREELTKMRWI